MKTFFWLFAVAVFSLILAVERVEQRRLGIEVGKIEREVSLKESRNQYLKYRITVLSSPAVVTEKAEERLNMKITPVENIVILNK
ncbi:hypothetical protein Emin_1255 [Elusimicrobium minutum Pei191]|uniref:Cell division protein FtsL n=1 Tax=Elusimicrobium minutum (strain Pei191) TaxID=445932 RepID=B2KE59_ELUMP|nr:hypothetical protein [Elusimicrobium minutum]ACC98805.1 hypothetical protein Emin_1255 [Elusimicrobium minutum Pei191]